MELVQLPSLPAQQRIVRHYLQLEPNNLFA